MQGNPELEGMLPHTTISSFTVFSIAFKAAFLSIDNRLIEIHAAFQLTWKSCPLQRL